MILDMTAEIVALESEVLDERTVIVADPLIPQSRELTPAETDTLNFHLLNSRSENTRKAYESQWRLFVSWCYGEGFIPFPVTTDVVCLYLSHLNDQGVKLSKIEQSLSAIKAVHMDNSDGTVLAFAHPQVKATLNSIRRSMAEDGRSKTDKPHRFTQDEVLAMVRACDGSTAQGIQDRAILLIGFNAGLRASEFCYLKAGDITFHEIGVDIEIRKSKGDQYGQGETVSIGGLAPHQRELDAPRVLKMWSELRSTYPQADGSLFIAFRKGGNTPHTINGQVHGLSREAITNTVIRCAKAAGLAPERQSFSSHSMRHSFVTQAFQRGLDAARISKTSRHKSLKTLMNYDQTSHRESSVAPVLWN